MREKIKIFIAFSHQEIFLAHLPYLQQQPITHILQPLKRPTITRNRFDKIHQAPRPISQPENSFSDPWKAFDIVRGEITIVSLRIAAFGCRIVCPLSDFEWCNGEIGFHCQRTVKAGIWDTRRANFSLQCCRLLKNLFVPYNLMRIERYIYQISINRLY